MIIFLHLSDPGGGGGEILNETVCQIFLDVRKTYDLVGMKVLYSILIEFGISMKLIVWLSKACLYKTYRKVHIGKHLFKILLIEHGLKQGDPLLTLLFNLTLECTIGNPRITGFLDFAYCLVFWKLFLKGLSKGSNRVGVSSPSSEDRNRSIFWNIVFSSFQNTGRWVKSENPVILGVIHSHQNPLECTIRNVLKNQLGLKLNGKRQLLVCADEVNFLGITWVQKAVIDAGKDVGLEVNTERTECMLISLECRTES
jgi:hypothetical protein